MKDFDATRKTRRRSEEERTFQLAGEVFVLKPAVHPEALETYDSITEETGIGETMRIVDELILSMIESGDDSEARYRMIRANTDDPVTIEDLQDLVQWMVEVQTARPTGQPGVSSPGQSSTETSLKEPSSSLAAVSGSPV